MKISIVFSKEDKLFLDKLLSHLKILERLSFIDEVYHKSLISPGENVSNFHNNSIANSNIVCVLVSSDFLESDYCYNQELKHIIESHYSGNIICVPILCRECIWNLSPLGELQPLPRYGKPIANPEWASEDSPYVNIVEGIKELIISLRNRAHKSNATIDTVNITEYANQLIKQFKVWKSRFVHIDSKEIFKEIPLYIEEIDWKVEQIEEKSIGRSGPVSELRNIVEENAIVIIAEAGMGKSTTLQYLIYKDAIKLNEENIVNCVIPVYIELKLVSIFSTVEKLILEKTNFPFKFLEEKMQSGQMSIFIDGLNEMKENSRRDFINDFKNFVSRYPLCPIIITSRPHAYEHDYLGIPIFMLRKLNDNQVSIFIEKNSPDLRLQIALEKEISSNERLNNIVRVPLMLYMFINVVHKSGGEIPTNKVKLIQRFVQNLYMREKSEKDITFDIDTYHLLLCWLGFKSREIKESNLGLTIYEILTILKERKTEYGLDIDILSVIRKSIEINILVKDGNKYSFAHEIYQEYYAAEEMYQSSIL